MQTNLLLWRVRSCYRKAVLFSQTTSKIKSSLAGLGWPGRVLFWALPVLASLTVLRILVGSAGGALADVWDVAFWATALLAAAVAWRALTRRLLWRVRNRLLVTCLLLGLAPIVLFGILTLSAAYLFAGQYATNTALRSLEIAASEVRSESGGLAVLSMMKAVPPRAPVFNAGQAPPPAVNEIALATREGNRWHDLNGSPGSTGRHSPFSGQLSPQWLTPGFQGVVGFNRQLYLCSESEVTEGGHAGLVLASLPLTPATMEPMAAGLGRIVLLPGNLGDKPGRHRSAPRSEAGVAPETTATKNVDGDFDEHVEIDTEPQDGPFERIGAGRLPPARSLLDVRVAFSAPLSVQNWDTGTTERALIFVVSRPSLLYDRLFATSVRVGNLIRIALLAAAGVVLFIYLLAVLMAVGLSRTITRSIAALYRGTTEIEAGNLAYRAPARGHDQLTALITSFNTMSESMQELMVQQREKERLESELSIAQEVQRSLFPHSPLYAGDLEVHAVCEPARVVSGDYYDFFAGDGQQLCIALGDISGKGMSAALLMASLHAAVRSLGLSAEAATDGGDPSSARLLGLLNRQLFQSTQPERYATLFLTFYDRTRRRLTYTNGGHLAPWLLRRDGSYRALDRGGPVVGLLSGLAYQETAVDCDAGDLLVAYSDGLTEAENDAGDFGEGRLLAFLTEHRHAPLQDIAAATLEQVRAWTGSREQTDDMTILLARVG